LHTATFNQIVAYEVSRGGFLDQHIHKINAIYRERRDVMLDTLAEHMPEGVSWTHPKGGLFLWVTLPQGMSSTELFRTAIAQKVAFVPGDSFYPYGGGENTMRLNYSNAKPEQINEGIARLGRAVKDQIARHN
jgi:2-aminoadipate transaminase